MLEKKMKLIFLGTGSAFTVGSHNFHSNMILENENSDRLLIDCGSDARFSLFEVGLSYRDITDVYISHLHADHVGGLEWLAFTSKFDSSCERPVLYISEKMVYDLWNKVLSGGLSSIQGVVADLSTFFKVKPVGESGLFIWKNIEFRAIQTVHIMSGFTIIPSFGLFFNVDGLNIFVTTDTQFSLHQTIDFYNMADIIFHDCETSPTKSGVHAHYTELLTLSETIRNKIWLYHYNPGPLPDAKKDGFRGFVKKGQCFDFNDPKTLF